jgi:hypothetical protein
MPALGILGFSRLRGGTVDIFYGSDNSWICLELAKYDYCFTRQKLDKMAASKKLWIDS